MYYISLTNFLTFLNNFYIISSYLGFPKSLPCTLISADELISNSIRKNTDIEAIRKDIPHIPYTRSDKTATSMFPYVTKQIPGRPVFPANTSTSDNNWILNYSSTPPHILHHQYFQIYGSFSKHTHLLTYYTSENNNNSFPSKHMPF